MSINSEVLKKFIENLPENCKTPLEKIITKMLETTKYIDGSTILYEEDNKHGYNKEHYHNWDCQPSKINTIEKNKNDYKEYNENNDIQLTRILGENSTPNIECIKGDVQLGKRLHVCIMMWMSIYIYNRTCFIYI